MNGKNNGELPIIAHQEEIVKAVCENQVVIVVGETGSGKTTLIPLFLYEAGFGDKGWVGITQPRRIAATSVARYVARQIGCRLGDEVGYKIRFDDETTQGTVIKFMTDGIILREIQSDPELSNYEVIVVDEAHERSLNIDFTLGLLKDLLKRRKDLKVLVTSATIDAEKFSKFFGNAPVINVSGRTYPVEIIYAPDKEIEEVVSEISVKGKSGDVLSFVAGWDDISKTMEKLKKLDISPKLEIIPVHGEMEPGEQDKIFARFPGKKKVSVATNIAETSITPDGVVCVIDTGWIKQTDFDPQTGIGSLNTVKHSKAGCSQRTGRAGRTQPGVCYRLYSEDDFNRRPEFTKPEILRTSLAGVILQMKALGIKNPEGFEFVDMPEKEAIRKAHQTLQALGALDAKDELTEIGWEMANLPLEPHIARMVIAAAKYGCLEEVLVVAASLSVHNIFPLIKDEEQKKLAAEAHAKFKDLTSDFLTLLKVWEEYRNSGFDRSWIIKNFLNWKALEEIRKIRGQLFSILRNHYKITSNSDKEAIAKAVATGLVENLLNYYGRHAYRTARGDSVYIHPSSAVFGGFNHPDWMVAAEIVTTKKTFARDCMAIKPEWMEEIAPQLCKYETDEIRFDSSENKVFGVLHVKFNNHGEIAKRRVEVIDERSAKALAEAIAADRIDLPCVGLNKSALQEIETLWLKSAGQVSKISRDRLIEFFVSELGTIYELGIAYTIGVLRDEQINLSLTDRNIGKILGIDYPEIRAKVLAENPDEVSICGKEYPVRYERDWNDKFKAVAEIEAETVFGLKAEDISKLPSGRVLTLKSAGYEKENLDELKSQIEEARLQKSWDEFRRTVSQETVTSDFVELQFDTNCLTGTPAVGYAIREVSYYSSGSYDLSRSDVRFTRDKKQAEETAELTRKIRQLAEIATDLPKQKTQFEEVLKNISDNKDLVEEEIRQARNLLETASESVFYSGSYIRKDCDSEILKKQIAEIGQRLPQVSELAVRRREVKSKAKETFDKVSEQVSKIRDLAYEESSHITRTDKESVNLAFEPLENAWRNGKYEEIEALSQKVSELVAKINERVEREDASIKILYKHLMENYNICLVCGREIRIPDLEHLEEETSLEEGFALCSNNHSGFLIGTKHGDVVKASRTASGEQVISLEVGKEEDYEERDYEDKDGIQEEWVPFKNLQLVIKVNRDLILEESTELIVETPWIQPTKEKMELARLRQELADLQAQKTEAGKKEAENSANLISTLEYAQLTFQKAQELKLFQKPEQNDWEKTAEWKEKRKSAAQEGNKVFILTFQKEGEELSSKVGFGEKLEAKIFIQPYPAIDPEEGKNFYCRGNQVLFVHRGGLGILVNVIGKVNASQEIGEKITDVQARIAELETAKGSGKKKEEGKTSSAAANLVAEMNKMWNK